MPEKEIINLIRDIPLAFIAVLLFAVWYYLRDSNKRLNGIEKKMISRIEFDNLKEDVENMKEGQVWNDVCTTFKDAIKDRIQRVETIFNGAHKN